jgi:hypothetical protein
MPARNMPRRHLVALCLAAVLHLAALMVMAATEADWVAKAAFLLSWALLNFFWLALARRPVVAALLALELVVALTLLSRFKFDKLWMTVDFVDVMIIDRDTSAFLLTVFPALRGWLALAAAATVALLILAWRLDPHRVRVRSSLVGGAFTPAGLSSTLDTLDAAYLPLVIQEAAGAPLDPSFSEQKEILQRCHGVFYRCADGAEARRFYRLLIDAGLVKGL